MSVYATMDRTNVGVSVCVCVCVCVFQVSEHHIQQYIVPVCKLCIR